MKDDEIRELLDQGLEEVSVTEKGLQSETFLLNGSVIQAPEMGCEDLITKNAFFHSKLSENGVSVPKILFNQRNPAFTVYNRVEGLDLVEAGKKLGEDRYLEALRETGKTLARIHQVEGCGYGEPDLENLEQGKYCSWRDFVTDEVREIEENVEAWQFDLVVDRALENLDLDEIPENPYSSGFHNDDSRENVIFN